MFNEFKFIKFKKIPVSSTNWNDSFVYPTSVYMVFLQPILHISGNQLAGILLASVMIGLVCFDCTVYVKLVYGRVSCHVPCQLTAAEEAAPDWRAMFRGAVMCEPRAFVPQQNPTSAGVCYSTINWECEWCGIPARALQSPAALAPANTISWQITSLLRRTADW